MKSKFKRHLEIQGYTEATKRKSAWSFHPSEQQKYEFISCCAACSNVCGERTVRIYWKRFWNWTVLLPVNPHKYAFELLLHLCYCSTDGLQVAETIY